MAESGQGLDSGLDDLSPDNRYASLQPTERERLEVELLDALKARDRVDGWWLMAGVGPPALAAMGFAFLAGHAEMIPVIFGLGAAVQIWRMYKARKRVKQIRLALEDPMDGS